MNHGNNTAEDTQRLYIDRLEAIEKAARMIDDARDSMEELSDITYDGYLIQALFDGLRNALEANR